MSVITKKIGTFTRVVRRKGVTGVMTVLKQKATPMLQPPLDYARLTPSALSLLTRHGRPDLLINAIGAGIGDDLLCTAVFHELKRRNTRAFWVTNKHPELYEQNDDIAVVAPPLPRYDIVLKQLGVKVVYPWYTSYNPAYDRDDPIPEQHLIAIMCQRAGITGTVALRPYLSLTEAEMAKGAIAPRQIAIQSSGLDAKHSMRNKNWSLERYQGVVDALQGRYDVVQVGSRNDPLLEGVTDLRGKTSLRETAAVLRGSLAFVGQVGFLMHLARAVDCRSVIVYGGRETPAQSGYPCNENLYSPVHCSPCWRLNSCPYERKCLQMISVADVVDGVERQVARHGTPLECDTDTITEADIARSTARYLEASAAHSAAWSVLYPSPRAEASRIQHVTDDAAASSKSDTSTPAARLSDASAPLVASGAEAALAMMSEPTGVMRVYERLQGTGVVYDGERVLSDVEYALKDVEEVLYTPPVGDVPSATLVSDRSIYGVVTTSTAGVLGDYVGARLRLRLADGRHLDWTVAKVFSGTAVLVQGLGRIAME